MTTMPDEFRAQLAYDGIPIARSLDDYFRQLTCYGRSALWLPHGAQPVCAYTLAADAPAGEGLTYAAIRRARAILNEGSPVAPDRGDPLTTAEVAQRIAQMHAWFASVLSAQPVDPAASPLSGSGYYGQSCTREIPDTPLEEWEAGVEALLADCEQWQAQTDEVLDVS